MKNLDVAYAERIAAEYDQKPASKLVALKKLDKKAKLPAEIFAYTFGVVGALLLGVGMCLCMGQIGSGSILAMAAGVVLGLLGILGAGVNYPIYRRMLEKGKRKYAFEIVELAKEISEKEK